MNYYNDSDPKACAWIEELIRARLIPAGKVDRRAIQDIAPADLAGFTQCHFFCGIAGWSLALQIAGWPEDVPVWTGSCPCQPFSAAGSGRGTADERHLWPVWFELIRACRPGVIFGEQVASAAVLGSAAKPARRKPLSTPELVWLDGVFTDLESAHYACGASDIPAAGIGAPHIRQRCYWVAYAQNTDRRREQQPGESTAHGQRGFAGDCELGGLADMQRPRLEGHDRHEPGRNGTGEAGSTAAGGSAGGLAIANGRQPGDGGLQRSGEHGQQPQNGGAGRLGHAAGDDERRQRESREIGRRESTSGGSDPWDNFQIIQCRDGKARRIPGVPQPGLQLVADVLPDDMDAGWRQSDGSIFPLAQGVQGRTGLLRGAGNAIVPHLAAEFIGAYLAALRP